MIDYEGASHTALQAPLAAHGVELTWELHAQIVGTKNEDWSAKIIEVTKLQHLLTPAQYVQDYCAQMDQLYCEIPAWDGAVALLHRLKEKGIPMAIATSSPRTSFDLKMKFHPEILDAMDAVVTGDEVSNGKPAPDIFLEAAKRIGCDPRRCVVFEDSPHG